MSETRSSNGTKEKKEEKKKTSAEPETPKSLLGAQSLYKYRPPRVDKVMYQIEVPPMLSLSERKIEHERVMSSVAKDFSNPILVWPGESDVKSEEEESNNLSSETIRSFLSKARSLFERSSSRALTSKCSDESQLLEFFINNDYDEQKALFKLEAELGLGVLESLEIRRIEDPSRIISAKGKVTKKNIPATNSWMAASKRCVVRGATQAQLLKVYEDGRLIVSSSPMSTGSSTKAEVLERFKMIEERLRDSRILRARAADYAATHAHLPRSRLQDIRGVLQSASAKKIKMSCEVKAVRSQQSESMSWDRDASALLQKMDQKDLEEGKPVCTSLELEDMIERGRALRVELSHLTYLEHKAELLRSYTECIRRVTRPDVNSATRARWVRWGASSDEIIPAERLKLPVLRCIVCQAEALRIDCEGVRQGRKAIRDAEQWLSNYEKTKKQNPSLDKLRRLVTAAGHLVVDLSDELKPLNEDIEKAVAWVSTIRKTNTVSEFNRRSVRSSKDGEHKENLNLNTLIDLVRKSEEIGFASNETVKMREMLDLVNEWTSDVRNVLKRCEEEYKQEDVSSSSKMDVDGNDEEEEENLSDTLRDLHRTFQMNIPVEDIPECEMLVAEISVREWRDNVRTKILGSNKNEDAPSLRDLEKLSKEGKQITQDKSWPYRKTSHFGLDITMERLLDILNTAQDWNHRASTALGKTRKSDTITADSIRNLVQESSSIAVNFIDTVSELNELATKFDRWQASAKLLADEIENQKRKLTFDRVNESVLEARNLRIESEERNKIESALDAAELWHDRAMSVLKGKHNEDSSVVDVINELLQSVKSLSIEPPDLETIEKLKNAISLGEKWRATVSRVLSETISRLESFGKKSITMSSNATTLLISSPGLEVYSITFSAEEMSKYTVANLVSLIDRVTRKSLESKKEEKEEASLILHGLHALGVHSSLQLNRPLSEVSFSNGTMLICISQSLLSLSFRSDTFRDTASSVLSRASSFDTSETSISSDRLVPFSNPMHASDVASEILEKLKPLLGENEALICASETSEYENLVQIVKELEWTVGTASKLKSSRPFELFELQRAVNDGEEMTYECMKCALPELRARFDYALLCMRIMKEALEEVNRKKQLAERNEKKSSKRSRVRRNDDDDVISTIASNFKSMLPTHVNSQNGTFAVSYVEMLKILMLARVLHVKMSDASLILEEMRRVRSWQERVLAALGDGEENSKNDKKISEEHVEKFIESSKHLLVPVSESRKLSNLLERSRDWVKRFRKAQNTQDSNGSTLQTLVREGQELPIDYSAMIEPILESITPYCLCRGVSKGFMLGCESCDEWFHGVCINVNEKDAEKIGTYTCANCIAKQDMESALQDATRFLTSRDVNIKVVSSQDPPTAEEQQQQQGEQVGGNSTWSANYYWKVINSAHKRMSKSQGDESTPQQQQDDSQQSILTNDLTKETSREEVQRTIRWFDRASSLVPHLVLAHESRKKSKGMTSLKLLSEVKKMVVTFDSEENFSKLTVHAVTRTPLYRALVMHIWIEEAQKSIGCISDRRPKLSDLQSLLTSASRRGIPSAKKVLKPIQDLVRRSQNWQHQVVQTLHSPTMKAPSLRKLRGFEKKVECLPIRGDNMDRVSKMLHDAIKNNGICVCVTCISKRAALAKNSMSARMIPPPPHNLINEKQIADMTRGQLGDTNMNPQQLLYLARTLGMPRPPMIPPMMMNGNRKHGRVENTESLPKAKKARLNTPVPPRMPSNPFVGMGMSSQFGLPPGMMMQGNPFLAAAYSTMFKQQGMSRPPMPLGMLNQQQQQNILRAASLQHQQQQPQQQQPSSENNGNNMK